MSINKASISINFVPQAIILALLLVCGALNMIFSVRMKIEFVAETVASGPERTILKTRMITSVPE